MTRPPLLLLAFLAVACSSASTSQTTPPPSGGPEDDGGQSTPDADAGPAPGCPIVGATTAPGKVSAASLDEASGIVASTTNPGVYWLHNDSGDSARAFAIAGDGTLRATLEFDTAAPVDIEDITIEDTASGSFLYFGDIGDNASARASLTLHRVAEPTLVTPGETVTAVSEKMTVTYSDGAHDAESLFFDPDTRELYVATKTALGPSAIHRIGAFVAGGSATTEAMASAKIPFATAADVGRDGRQVVIRNYGNAFVWPRAVGEPLAVTLSRPPPCVIPMPTERQGESIAFLPNGKGFITLSEGAFPDLHVTPFE